MNIRAEVLFKRDEDTGMIRLLVRLGYPKETQGDPNSRQRDRMEEREKWILKLS